MSYCAMKATWEFNLTVVLGYQLYITVPHTHNYKTSMPELSKEKGNDHLQKMNHLVPKQIKIRVTNVKCYAMYTNLTQPTYWPNLESFKHTMRANEQ